MNQKLKTLFRGRNVERHDFLYNYFNILCEFLGGNWNQNKELYIYAREILKNIHDHNGGYGYANIEVMPDSTIILEIGNSPCPDSVEKEHTPDHKVNCSVGLSILNDIDLPFIYLETAEDINYQYKIIYNPSLLPADRLKTL